MLNENANVRARIGATLCVAGFMCILAGVLASLTAPFIPDMISGMEWAVGTFCVMMVVGVNFLVAGFAIDGMDGMGF